MFTATVHPLNFSVLSGENFEQLVFAAVARRWLWKNLAWNGQVGGDAGRDIIGIREDDLGKPHTYVFACANWQSLTFAKAEGDIDKIVAGSKPAAIVVVCGSTVSADMRQRIVAHGRSKGVADTAVWSGAELEEMVRMHAPSVLERFFHGVPLPAEDVHLASPFADKSDAEKALLLEPLFDREAFGAKFQEESSLPAFRSALTSTIEAFNTGLSRSRDGTAVRRVPRRDEFTDVKLRAQVDTIYQRVVLLRTRFDEGLRAGTIKQCSCTVADCPTFHVVDEVCDEMNMLRDELQLLCRALYGRS